MSSRLWGVGAQRGGERQAPRPESGHVWEAGGWGWCGAALGAGTGDDARALFLAILVQFTVSENKCTEINLEGKLCFILDIFHFRFVGHPRDQRIDLQAGFYRQNLHPEEGPDFLLEP